MFLAKAEVKKVEIDIDGLKCELTASRCKFTSQHDQLIIGLNRRNISSIIRWASSQGLDTIPLTRFLNQVCNGEHGLPYTPN